MTPSQFGMTTAQQEPATLTLKRWTCLEAGNVASIAPAVCQLSSVTISGAQSFGGGSSVKTLTIQGVEATIREQSGEVIEAVLEW